MKMPNCFSCNRIIAPGERAVKFPCPSCASITIWRCERCRILRRQYKCPSCGFTGP
ncbi:MAG: zinc finger domain-containing protein [Candidatus Bathyarchaeia archaeon]